MLQFHLSAICEERTIEGMHAHHLILNLVLNLVHLGLAAYEAKLQETEAVR